MADTQVEELGTHADGCKGEWVELHRIDPEESRPPLGTTTVGEDGAVVFTPKHDKDGTAKFGPKKYTEKVIVSYCPLCGRKKEEPWTE